MIDVEDRGPVTLVTIRRPERRNAVDQRTLEQLAAAIATSCSGGTRVLVLRGEGDHFCAGADLTGVEGPEFAAVLRTVLDGLREAQFATIAAVTGVALGAGTQLAIACDLRVASADARFGIPAARLGLAVDHWTVRRLADLAGHGPARAMLLAAEVLTGEDLHRTGFVQRVGGPEDALAWADEIAALAPLTIAAHKLALERLDRGRERESDPEVDAALQRAWQSADLQEGLAAFRERRRPLFHGH